MFSNKNSRARIIKLVKTLMEFFWKIAILTENPINLDVTCSVILSTMQGRDYAHVFTYLPNPLGIFRRSDGSVDDSDRGIISFPFFPKLAIESENLTNVGCKIGIFHKEMLKLP